MTRSTLARLTLAAALAISIPGAAAAQADPFSPEDTNWHLASYALDGATESVPWTVDATLLLQDGAASGSSGCNTFNGTYTLEGEVLTFDEAFAVTRMACPNPQTSVENAYLTLLPQTATWAITDGMLVLSNDLGTPILTYEQPVLALTESDLAAIAAQFAAQQAEITKAGERIDNIRIGTLRERIKELEGTVSTLQSQAAAAASSSSSSSSAFNAKEKVLLKAIPNKVKRTCQPLRSRLPSGTVAAVACDGSRNNVAQQAYYLMEWEDAEATLKSVASAKGVPNRQPRCHNQKAGWETYGASVGAEGCWIDNGKANFRLITRAAGCKQLDVAGTHLTEPAIYLAMEGKNNKLEPLRAAGLAYTDSNYFIINGEAGQPIPAGRQPQTPGCRAHTDRVG